MKNIILGAAAIGLLLATGCDDGNEPTATTTTTAGSGGGQGGDGQGGDGQGGDGQGGDGGAPVAETAYVFTMSNAADINELLVFERGDDGGLTELESLPTGGLGSGDGLGSQGALVLSPSREYLYVVNPGSDQISSFRIYDDHLALVDLVPAGGDRPISLTASDDRLYVVNAGDGNVVGFETDGGVLTPIAGADRPLSMAGGTGPAQVGLSPSGDALIVTEKATNSLLTYWVAPDGSLSQVTVTASEGQTPFGFDFAPDGTLVVSEAFGGMDAMSAVSSYTIGSVEPMVVSSSVPSAQTAACWLLVANGAFAYTTNTASNTISGYTLGEDGSLTLFDDGGVTADLGAEQSPIDMALSDDHAYLYVLNAKSDTVVGYAVEADGALTELDAEMPVAPSAVGLAAR